MANNKIRSNLSHWQTLQEQDYFEAHPLYQGHPDPPPKDIYQIEAFTPLTKNMKLVVIGCGYGRESAHLAARAAHVYGIDVSTKILEKASNYLRYRGVTNFTPVLAESYGEAIPAGIDLIYSVTVMQHLTRDLVRDYFQRLGDKLAPYGAFVVQFFEGRPGTYIHHDAELKVYEPSVTWAVWEIIELCENCGLNFRQAKTTLENPTSLWHWVWITKDREPEN